MEIIGLFTPTTPRRYATRTGCDVTAFPRIIIQWVEFMNININSRRGKKLELLALAYLNFHQPQIVAIQKTKMDSSISTSTIGLIPN